MSRLPAVTTVAAASHLPLSDERQIGIRLEHAAPDDFHFTANSLVSPGYFRAMGIPLLRGREFTARDTSSSVPAAVVSEAFVRQYLPGVEPLGQRFQWGDRALFTIVGVAQDVHIAALDADPPPMVYDSMFQVQSGASGRMALVFRTSGNTQVPLDEVKRVVSSIDPDLPIYGVTSLSILVSDSLAQRKFTLLVLAGFAFIAALLAVIGLFGVLSYIVEQRRKEIGVRMALGATRNSIVTLVLRRGLALGVTRMRSGSRFIDIRFIVAQSQSLSRGPLRSADACGSHLHVDGDSYAFRPNSRAPRRIHRSNASPAHRIGEMRCTN